MERTELLLGTENTGRLENAHVLIFGLGGVGSYAAEQLVRAGLGSISMVDGDKITESNINRQLPATRATIGLEKGEVLRKRYLDINPELKLKVINTFIPDMEMEEFIKKTKPDFVVDAIDTLSPKTYLIKACIENSIPLVSSMGAAARLDPTKVEICDISKSHTDRLAFNIRRRLRDFNIHKGFKVVFSSEPAKKEAIIQVENERNKKSTAGTISYMPAIFGLYCASVVIREITKSS